MSNAQFWTYLYLLIHMPYQCEVGVRAAGYWIAGSAGFQVHTAVIYGGSCIQSFWLAFGHPTLDWWAVGADV